MSTVVRFAAAAALFSGLLFANPVWALSDAQQAQVYTRSPAPFRFVRNWQEVDSVDWLYTQIYTAELMNRDDIAEGAIERLLAISPTDPVGLSARARLSVRQNELRNARHILNQLISNHPEHDSVLLLQSYLAIYTDRKAEYRQLHLLEKLGQTAEAVAKYEALFPHGMPTFQLQLDYLVLLGKDDANWERVKQELEVLNFQHPGVPALQLRLASHLRLREERMPWVLATLQRLSLDPKIGREAAAIWLRTLASMPVDASWAQQHAIMASYFPRDFEIQQANQSAQSRWLQEKERLKDPTYRARLKGIALIEADNRKNLPAAYRHLTYALTTRPNDPLLLEAMGKYYLRQGQPGQALTYFKRAEQHNDDPDLVSKYQTLVETTRYWWLLDQGDVLADKGNLHGAGQYYEKAQAIYPEEPESYTRLAGLALAAKKYPLAISRYRQALQRDALSGTALRGLLNVYKSQGGAQAALQQAKALPPTQRAVVRQEIDALKVEVLLQRLQGYPVGVHTAQISEVIHGLVQLNPTSPWVRKEIAEQLVRLGRSDRADQLMADWANKSRDPEMAFAYGLYLSQQDRLEEAVAVMAAVPESKRSDSFEANFERLQFEHLVNRAVLLNEQEPEKAAHLLQGYTRPDDVEGQLRLASAWLRLGNREQAQKVIGAPDLSVMDEALLLQYGELLVALDDDEAFRQWRAITRQRQFIGEHKTHYYQIVANYELYGRRADFAIGNIRQAHQTFQVLLHAGIENQDEVALRLAQTSRQLGDRKTFSSVTQSLLLRQSQLAYSQQVQLAAVLYEAGENEKARQVLSRLAERKGGSAVDNYESLNLAMADRQWKIAEKFAYQALLADRQEKQGTTPRKLLSQAQDEPPEAAAYRPSLENLYREADDDWLTRNVKADIDTLRAREEGHIKIGIDYGFREDENRDLQVPVEARIPFSEYDGHLVVKLDYVQINSGEQDFYDSDIRFEHQDAGTALGIGWEAENWRADIGTTPVGFLNTQLVGGVERVDEIDNFSLKTALSRRPETSTTLSYSGMTLSQLSEVSGKQEWGGVVRTGGSLGLSWDQGGPYGFWSSAQYHVLTGKNTEDNTRRALLGGGYWKLIAEEDKQLKIGLGAFYMGYDKNLGEYAFRHGGYYSPQSYFSVSLPVSYYGRYQDSLAYSVNASVSNSWSRLDAPYGLSGSEETGGGFGYSLQVGVEKRVAPKWYLGAMLDIERSESYEPNHFQLYIKYTFGRGWQPIQTPPEPITLNSDYY